MVLASYDKIKANKAFEMIVTRSIKQPLKADNKFGFEVQIVEGELVRN